jgi:hypothetical protein
MLLGGSRADVTGQNLSWRYVMFEPVSETMGGSGGSATASPTLNPDAGSLLSELSGVFQDTPPAVEPRPALEEPDDDSGSHLNELTGTVDHPLSAEQPSAAQPVAEELIEEPTPKEPEMTLSPPRVEPPAFFWKPKRRGFLRRR